jgi:tetratricopeptide (TPR) repeat protein
MSELRRRFWVQRSEPFVLAAMALLAVALFAFTSVATRAFKAQRSRLGQEWFARGVAHLGNERPAEAIADFRNALVYNREDQHYSLRLAQALAATGRIAEAEAYLLNLWERAPGDSTINLELARLAAKDGRVEAAHRYYHNAVYGVWDGDAEEQRRRVRWELVEVLLARGRNDEAVAELVSLVADLPNDDVRARVRAADMYRRAGEHERALAEYAAALRRERDNPAALAGTGESAFALGRYGIAERYLSRARRADPKNAALGSLLEVARAALELDPYAYRLSSTTRAERAVRAFAVTVERLQRCAAEKGLAIDGNGPEAPLVEQYGTASAMKPRVTPERLRRDEAALDTTMDLVFRSQQLAAQECGPGSAADEALLLLGRRAE